MSRRWLLPIAFLLPVVPQLRAQVRNPSSSFVAPPPQLQAASDSNRSIKPVVVGAAIGAIIGGYVGALAIGSCENATCPGQHRTAPLVGVVVGGAVGGGLGYLLAELNPTYLWRPLRFRIRLSCVPPAGRLKHCG
jgi:hypothetical protein